MKKILLLIILNCIVLSCINDNAVTKEKKRNFSFCIPEIDLTVTTSKQAGGRFYTIFTKDSIESLPDSIVFLPDTVAYIASETQEMGPISFIINPAQKDSIYIVENPYIEYIQSSKYKLCLLKYQERESRFFEPQIGTEPLILKYPYIHIVISTDTYTIDIDRYKITQETIKKGDIHGGWQ